MTNQPKILAFTGSMRKEALNRRLLLIAARAASDSGATVTEIELRDFKLPVYDGDFEAEHGLPEDARTLKGLFHDHDGLLIASPENNSGYSAALKNAIDWVSRPASPDEPMLQNLRGKVAAIMAASPGRLGGLRGLEPLRTVLTNVGMLVIPEQRAISGAHEAFAEDGSLKNDRQHDGIRAIGIRLAEVIARLN